MNFTSVVPRSARRVRLVFDGALAASAFTSTTYYAIANTDGLAPSPTVSGVVAIVGQTNQIELATSLDLIGGAQYTVTVTAAPAADLTTCTGSLPMQLGAVLVPQNSEPATNDVDEALYLIDLVWSGDDFVEDASGDLATISGIANLKGAIERRWMQEGLPYDPSYGVKSSQYVDGAAGAVLGIKGEMVAQARQDPRVRSVDVSLTFDPLSPGKVLARGYIVPITLNDKLPISLDVTTTS